MADYYPQKKSPLLAALLGGLIPGLGHIYNEQVGKGIFIFSLLLGTAAMVVLSITGNLFMASLWGFHGDYFITQHPSVLSKFIVVLAIFLFIPLLVLYSMADAYITSTKINRGEIPLGGYPIVDMPPPPPHSVHANSTVNKQEAEHMDATHHAGTAHANASTGNAYSETQSQPNSATANHTASHTTSQSSHSHHNASTGSNHGRLVLGIILVAMGFFFMVEDMGLHYLRFENLWPLIPLFFGLRQLREYQIDGIHSQKVLGVTFTLFGGIFLLHNWTDIDIFNKIGNYWYLIPLLIGLIILITDFRDKNQKKNSGDFS